MIDERNNPNIPPTIPLKGTVNHHCNGSLLVLISLSIKIKPPKIKPRMFHKIKAILFNECDILSDIK